MGGDQWPVYVVFHQDLANKPHRHAGSVHAPDAEMALMNARDVFVRRPDCTSLWVAPASHVHAWTMEELDHVDWESAATLDRPEPGEYAVFQKVHHSGSCSYTGLVNAKSPLEALKSALALFADTQVLVWWLIPERSIARTEDSDTESMFEPASRKAFRHQSDFKTLTLMRQLKSESEEEPDEGD